VAGFAGAQDHTVRRTMTVTILVAAALALALAGAGGALTEIGPWYRNLRKPSWQPPDWLFGPAWTLILGMAAAAGVLAWTHAHGAGAHWRIAILFAANFVFHLLWSPLFFKFRRPDWALIEVPFLWLSILGLVIGLAPYSTTASWLVVPYLAWVTFAAWLNLTIVRLNRPFAATREAVS
jgi:tryptophan-rich sensory protein